MLAPLERLPDARKDLRTATPLKPVVSSRRFRNALVLLMPLVVLAFLKNCAASTRTKDTQCDLERPHGQQSLYLGSLMSMSKRTATSSLIFDAFHSVQEVSVDRRLASRSARAANRSLALTGSIELSTNSLS